MAKTSNLTVQKWGNSLAVRIPASMARSAHVHSGSLVELRVIEGGLFVKLMDQGRMTLAERLEAFDPNKHGGEVMSVEAVGLEKL